LDAEFPLDRMRRRQQQFARAGPRAQHAVARGRAQAPARVGAAAGKALDLQLAVETVEMAAQPGLQPRDIRLHRGKGAAHACALTSTPSRSTGTTSQVSQAAACAISASSPAPATMRPTRGVASARPGPVPLPATSAPR